MTPKLYKQIFSILNAATNYNVGGENITITDVNGMVSLGEKVENSVDLRKSFLNGLLPVIGRITSYAMGLRRETRGIEKTCPRIRSGYRWFLQTAHATRT